MGPAVYWYPSFLSATATFHNTFPVRASSAIRCASPLALNTLLSKIAMLRCTPPPSPPPCAEPAARSGRYSQNRLPDAASRACTTPPGFGKYIVPFATRGVASLEPAVIPHDQASV